MTQNKMETSQKDQQDLIYFQNLVPGLQESPPIERPLANSFAPYALTGEHWAMIPLMPDHQYALHADIFGKPGVMQYFGPGKCFTFDEYTPVHLEHVEQNVMPQYDRHTGRVSQFTWTIITKDGVAGRLQIYPAEGRTALAFCISPAQQGRALARRAAELVVAYAGEESSFIATAHPQNKASANSLLQVHYPDGRFVFFRDQKRQNVPDIYGPNQPRDYFLSQRRNEVSFFSFIRGHVPVNESEEIQNEAVGQPGF